MAEYRLGAYNQSQSTVRQLFNKDWIIKGLIVLLCFIVQNVIFASFTSKNHAKINIFLQPRPIIPLNFQSPRRALAKGEKNELIRISATGIKKPTESGKGLFQSANLPSGYLDSNQGPPAPKAGALTGLRYTPNAMPHAAKARQSYEKEVTIVSLWEYFFKKGFCIRQKQVHSNLPKPSVERPFAKNNRKKLRHSQKIPIFVGWIIPQNEKRRRRTWWTERGFYR